MALAAVDQCRLLLGADRLCLPAACAKAAAGRWVRRVRDVALEDDALPLAALRRLLDRDRRQERLGVRVRRPVVDVLLRADLDDLAEIHHRDAVGDVPDEREVVRDEQIGEAEVALQRLEEVDDLRADRHVERRDGLVEDDHLRVEGERARESDPLALAARELVREAVRVFGAEAHRAQQLVDPAATLTALVEVVHAQRLRHDLAHRHARVERCVRILEDDLQLAPHFAHAATAEVGDVLAVEKDLAVRRRQQLDHGAAERRLAAAGLADEAERLTRAQRQVDTVDGVDLADAPLEDPGGDREVLVEPVDAEDLAPFFGALVDPLLDRFLDCFAHASAPTGSTRWPVRPSSSSAKWHADRWAESPIGRNGGSSSRQRMRPCERKHRG